jgi:hypothetical protein
MYSSAASNILLANDHLLYQFPFLAIIVSDPPHNSIDIVAYLITIGEESSLEMAEE